MVDPDITFLVAYSCPRCHAPLEARASGSPSWLRCPECGRAGLVPESTRRGSSTFADDRDWRIGDVAAARSEGALPIQPRGMAPLPPSSASKTPRSRIFLGAGFFLATILCLFSLLAWNGGQAGAFGFVAIVCLIRLIQQPRRPSRE